jgi:putative flippase GtrA
MTSRALRMANRKEVRYVLVGGWNTLFGWAVFVALQLTVGATIGYMAVLVIAQVVSIINAYLCYRWLVFRVQGSWWMVSALGMNVIVSQTVFVVVTVIASYIAHNRFSFRRSDPPAP